MSGPDLIVATMLWDPNDQSLPFSRWYDESWVEKLYTGFRRHLSVPFRFVCFTDRWRDFSAPIEQRKFTPKGATPGYGDFVQPYQLDRPMILVGLDTIITGRIDHLAAYCLTANMIALPRDPYAPAQACNGVALVPAGNRRVFEGWAGENDMEWMRAQPHRFIDDVFPGHVLSYKVHIAPRGRLGSARIVYFHGEEKPNQLQGKVEWIDQAWRI